MTTDQLNQLLNGRALLTDGVKMYAVWGVVDGVHNGEHVVLIVHDEVVGDCSHIGFPINMPEVTIAIKGGAAHLVSPAGAKVTVLDYDVDGVDESRLEEDDEGDKFERIEVWA